MSELRIALVAEGPTDYEVVAAALRAGHALLAAAECNPALESRLAQLPKKQRIKKSVPDYRNNAPAVTAHWARVKQVCPQALAFERALADVQAHSLHKS